MIQLVVSFVLAFVVCYLAMPSIIRIAFKQGIVDAPDYRKSHSTITPSFGGVGIFLGCAIVSLLMVPAADMHQLRYILAALFVIFTVGARDDLDPLKPAAKLMGQLIGIAILMFYADIRITSLHGLFGFYEVNIIISYILTGVVFVFLINSFNLIDGIDALCASISIFVLIVLGAWFYLSGETFYSMLATTCAGATMAFLRYNVSPSKIFMGDTGSLVLGCICTILVIQMLRLNIEQPITAFHFESVISVAFGLLVLPVFDTLRVFIVRILKAESPFLPDKNHIHHKLLELGLSHMQASGLLLSINAGFLLLALELQHIPPTFFVLLALGICWVLTQILIFAIGLKKGGVLRTDP